MRFQAVLVLLMLGTTAGIPQTVATNSDLLRALIRDDRAARAEQLMEILTSIRPELKAEVRLRAAMETGQMHEVQRMAATMEDQPVGCLAQSALAFSHADFIKAESYCRQGLSLPSGPATDPLTTWELNLLLADTLFRQERPAEALRALLANGHLDAKHSWSPYAVLLNETASEAADNAHMLERALSADPDSSGVYQMAFAQSLRSGDINTAIPRFLRASRLHWQFPIVTQQNVVHFEAFRTNPPTGPRPATSLLWAEMAQLALDQEHLSVSAECGREAESDGSRPPETRWLLAHIQLDSGNWGVARTCLEPLAAIFPLAARDLAKALAELGKFEYATWWLDRLPPGIAQEPAALLTRVRCLAGTNHIVQAKALLAQLATRIALATDYWIAKSDLSLRQGMREQGERDLAQVVLLRRFGLCSRLDCRKASLFARTAGWKGLERLLLAARWRPAATRPGAVDVLSAFAHRALADRAAVDGNVGISLELLDHGREVAYRQLLTRTGINERDVQPDLTRALVNHGMIMNQLAFVLARNHVQTGDAVTALEDLRPQLVGHPSPSALVYILAATAAGQMGDRDRMSAYVAGAAALGSKSGGPWEPCTRLALLGGSREPIFWLGRELRAQHEPSDNPGDIVAILGLGGFDTDALRYPTSADSPGIHLGRGVALLNLGQRAAAIAELARVTLTQNAWVIPALTAMAQVAALTGDKEQLAACLKDLVREGPDEAATSFVRGLLQETNHDWAGAEAAAIAARERAPLWADPVLLLARIAQRRQQPPGSWLEEACRIEPHRPDIWEAMAIDEEHRHADAIPDFRRAAKMALAVGNSDMAVRVLTHIKELERPPLKHGKPELVDAFRILINHLENSRNTSATDFQDVTREAAYDLVDLDNIAALEIAKKAAQYSFVDANNHRANAATVRVLSPVEGALIFAAFLLFIPAVSMRHLAAARRGR